MQKILLLIDQEGFNKSAFEFGCYLAKMNRSALTGVFMVPEPSVSATYPNRYFVEGDAIPVLLADDSSEEKWRTQLENNKKEFAIACSKKGIRWNEYTQPIHSVDELVNETRFTDLLIVNACSSFDKTSQTPPSDCVKEILYRSECPVVIAPLNFTGIDEVLFAYDGSASAVYAMKQFTYLFPELSDTKAVFLEVNEKGEAAITDQEKIGDYLKMHYSAIGFHILYGKASDELFSYLLDKKNIFVVTGAYGRSLVSSILRRSTAELLLKATNLPVFIAHH